MAFNLTGIEVSLDLAIIGSIIVALITWKTTKDKELNEQKKKEKEKKSCPPTSQEKNNEQKFTDGRTNYKIIVN